MINRRQMLYGGLLLPMVGCGHRDARRCELAYANLTGDWISGLVKIGDRFSDAIASLPLGAPGVAAPVSIISGKLCRFKGIYGFSNRSIDCEGTVPACPSSLVKPYCHIEIRKDAPLRIEWLDRRVTYHYDELARLAYEDSDLRFAVAVGAKSVQHVGVAFRQRSRLLGAHLGRNARNTSQNNTREVPRWMIRTSLSPLLVLGFSNEPPDGDYDCWRIPLDFNSPELVHLRDHHLWIEPQVDGTVRLGRFSTDATSTKELTDRFVAKQFPQATDFVTLKAQRTKRYPMPHYPDDFISYMLDLRFDDER